MTVGLRRVTADNWVACIEFSATDEQQRRGYVAPNTHSLAQACYEPWWIPPLVYSDDTPIGCVMYGRWPTTGIPEHHGGREVGTHYVLRMMVDARYQSRGYGRAAMEAVIERIVAEPDAREIQLDYDAGNTAAARAHLYTSLGFVPISETADGEITARLLLRNPATPR